MKPWTSHFLFVLSSQIYHYQIASAILMTRNRALQVFHFGLVGLDDDVMTCSLPLVFLPTAGCLGVSVDIQNRSYLAVLDTGSPFLTAPPSFGDLLDAGIDPTLEQYGEAVGETRWKQARRIDFGQSLTAEQFTLGVVTESIVRESGGIYLGLLNEDDNRPTFLHQVGYTSFIVDYQNRVLELYERVDIFSKSTSKPWPMFDLTPYGPNLYHYGTLCESLTLLVTSVDGELDNIRLANTKRPIVVVIDTGLTGCILSDSFREEIGTTSLQSIVGAEIALERQRGSLVSDQKHWYLSCFRLPWFTDDANHPHIVAAGATFLQKSRLMVDAKRRLIALQKDGSEALL